MKIAVTYPFQQFCDQPGYIVWQRSKMQNVALLVHHAHRTGAEVTGLFHQSSGHNSVGAQQVIHRIWIQRIHHFVDLIGVFDFCNILGRSDDLLAVEDGSYLLKA